MLLNVLMDTTKSIKTKNDKNIIINNLENEKEKEEIKIHHLKNKKEEITIHCSKNKDNYKRHYKKFKKKFYDKMDREINEYSFIDIINVKWLKVFYNIPVKIFIRMEKKYKKIIENSDNIFPTHENVFNFTNFCSPEDTYVLILGQDPYHGLFYDKETKEYYPEAVGISFSVPMNCPIPSSLQNIYKNQIRNDIIETMPGDGCLEDWARQGVLMLNSALTVEKKKPNCHKLIWKKFTDCLVKSISLHCNNLIYVVWGKEAFIKLTDNVPKELCGRTIISSHPSGYSAASTFREHGAFNKVNHFGKINDFLEEMGKNKINW